MMKTRKRFHIPFGFVVIMLLAVILSGCSDSSSTNEDLESQTNSVPAENTGTRKNIDKKKKKKKHLTPFKVDKLPPDAAVIVIDGRKITQRQYVDWLDVRCRMSAFQEGKPLVEENLARIREGLRARVPGELIRNELVQYYAMTNHIVPSAADLKVSERILLQDFGRKVKTIDQMARVLGGVSTNILSNLIYLNALDEICLAKNATNDISKVTDAEVDAHLARVKKWNEIAAKKDNESREKAAQAKKEILGGAFFADVARKYAEVSPEDGVEWDTVELGEFQADEPIAKWLISAKQGDISDPIEYDDVIAIFGLVRMYKGEAPEGFEPMMQYELVRCAFHAYEKIEMPDDREDLRASMLQERRSVVFRTFGSKLLETVKIEFPYGEDIFNEAHTHLTQRKPRKGRETKKKSTQQKKKKEIVEKSKPNALSGKRKEKNNEENREKK